MPPEVLHLRCIDFWVFKSKMAKPKTMWNAPNARMLLGCHAMHSHPGMLEKTLLYVHDTKKNETFIHPKAGDYVELIKRVAQGEKPISQVCFPLGEEGEAFEGGQKDIAAFKEQMRQAKLDSQMKVQPTSFDSCICVYRLCTPRS